MEDAALAVIAGTGSAAAPMVMIWQPAGKIYVNRREKQMKKNKKKRQYKKPLRRITIVVTPQTDYHLCELCAQMGYGEKDKGRVVDKLVAIHQAASKGGNPWKR